MINFTSPCYEKIDINCFNFAISHLKESIFILVLVLSITLDILFFVITYKARNELLKYEVFILNFQNALFVLTKLIFIVHFTILAAFVYYPVNKYACLFLTILPNVLIASYTIILLYSAVIHLTTVSQSKFFVLLKKYLTSSKIIFLLIFFTFLALFFGISILYFWLVRFDSFILTLKLNSFEICLVDPRAWKETGIYYFIIYFPSLFIFFIYLISILIILRKYNISKKTSTNQSKRFKKYLKVLIKFLIYSINFVIMALSSWFSLLFIFINSESLIIAWYILIYASFGLLALNPLFLIFIHEKLKIQFKIILNSIKIFKYIAKK